MVQGLQITSAMMSTIVLSAYYAECIVYHHLFLLVTVFSIWYHCTHDAWIAIIDKCIAHMAFMTVIWIESPKLKKETIWLMLFPAIVLILWICEIWFMKKKREESTLILSIPITVQRIHICLHLMGIIGMHCFIFQQYVVPEE